jgi:hypothetical protein
MKWIIPLSIWSNDILLILGVLLARDITQLQFVIYIIVALDVVATLYWRHTVKRDKRRRAKILDTLMYTQDDCLHVSGKKQDLSLILSAVNDILSRTKGETVKIRLRR